MQPRAHVLVIQHVEREGSAAIGEALRANGIDERTVYVHRGEAVPARVGEAGGLLVMGGPMGVYEADRYPHLRDELRLIEDAIARRVPVLGVCLGSQLIAAALGARVSRGAKIELGWHEVRLRDAAQSDALWAGCPPSFVPLHWHGDVFELPAGAVSLAWSRQTEHQAFRSGDGVWGVLFHLEMRAPEIEAMADTFGEDLAAAGVTREDVAGPAQERVVGIASIAARVYGAWADRVRSSQRS